MSTSWWPLWGSPEPEAVMEAAPPHPYYPLGVSVPGYAANESPVPVLLASFAGVLTFVLAGASAVALRLNPSLSRSNLAVFAWFVLSYFVLNHATVASSQDVLAQLWKEYALSDSRYLTSDPFMLSVEGITSLVWGPLCLLNAAAIVGRSPARHVLRIVVCVAHLYGVALYYATSQADARLAGREHSRPETLYYWVYYVGLNLPWAIVPAVLLYDSARTVTRALRALDKAEAVLDAHRSRVEDTVGSKKTK
ncbi:Emopamil binding protein-domain-containing protein [Durotheca rogersii]|uniref:Emopamil binding protein-domain-containing protein n=1 Tax=Durotheca rogersii TaxID=419775 RepID=UPI00221EF13D|nr:Emopamil binding protein-domain-containing protein [Durotheca rogersii]KAI5868092.1 Emopamil binding protein-domain-containing protein [Durotheca rogersii]